MKSVPALFAFIALLSSGASAETVQGDFYPPLAMRMHQEGKTGFEAEYGPGGLVINCRITKSSGFAALDDATCPIVKRQSERIHHAPGIRGDVMIWRIKDMRSKSNVNQR